MREFDFWAGIDWASKAHEVCLVNHEGAVVDRCSVRHDVGGLDELNRFLLKRGPAARVAVAIETPRGSVVEFLVERGFQVFSINPKQLDRFRDRFTVAGVKDDRLDAQVLGDSLRTDEHRFRKVRLDAPAIIEVRGLSRMDQELSGNLARASNRLREQLFRYRPGLLEINPGADEPWFWELVQMAPTHAEGAALRPGRLRGLLKRHRITKLDSATLSRVLTQPAMPVAPGVSDAATLAIAMLIPQLQLLHEQQKACRKRLDARLKTLAQGEEQEHRDVQVLRSFPGVGRGIAAAMLSEASGPLAARDYQTLRAQAGVAPVTRRSGKRRTVSMRRACIGSLRLAVHHWANASIRLDVRFREKYDRLRAKGHSHARALRTLGDGLLRVLIAMLRAGSLYDARLPTPKTA